ncbi:TonB-dependent receptor [Flavobacteriaceae bacterium]|nr:TonB-dependent receptor [Flavobacteriaceae bacterium]
MKVYTLKLLTFFTFLMSFQIMAQREVTGNVSEQGTDTPLPGVSILVEGKQTGATTDFDGKFNIKVDSDDVLIFSYLGFTTQKIKITDSNIVDVQLEFSMDKLEEVILIGYGTQSRKEVTGSVAMINSETIEQLKPVRIEQALQGQMPGVAITSASGAPGSGSNIRIRGISTNGNNNPLILVDGNVIEDLSVINPSDIENINILKDATAGIYGVRASNGVILITTKSGRKNTPFSLSYDGYFGVQNTSNYIRLLNATEYAIIINEAAAVAGNPPVHNDFSAYGKGTNWQNEVFSSAPIMNHNIRTSGGTDKFTYSLGASYLDQDGIVGKDKSNFNRITFNTNLSFDVNEKFKINGTAIYTNSNQNRLSENALGSVLFNAINMKPTLPVKNADGSYSLAEGLGNEVINPMAQINNTDDTNKIDKISATLGIKHEFAPNFFVESRFQYNHSKVKTDIFKPVVDYGSGKVFNISTNELVDNDEKYEDYTWDNFLKYEKTLNDAHQIKVLIGGSMFKTTGVFESYTGTNFSDEAIKTGPILADANNILDNNAQIKLRGANTFDVRLLSYFARAQYDYKGKYLFSAMIRRDGSTRFGPNNRFGYFPSASMGWIISEESFLSDANFIDFMKIRGSFGIIGNDRIGDYRYLSTLGGEAKYSFNELIVEGLAEGALANPNIKWEEQEATNIGLDLSFMNNQLDFSVDAFSRKTKNLLLTPQVSGILGAVAPGSAAPTVNAGTVENKGLEFLIAYRGKLTEDLNFRISANLTALKNEVLFVASQNGFEQGGAFGVGQEPPLRMEAGYPIGFFYGYKTNGVFQNQDEIDNDPVTSVATSPGDFKFVDIDEDGEIDLDDRTNIGDPHPDYTLGFNFGFDYKNIDFSASAFGAYGNEIIRNFERNQPLVNKHVSILGRWTGPNSTNSNPRVTAGTTPNSLFSDYFVEDGSYLRIQNVQIGYTFPKALTEKEGIDHFRLYGSVSNLYTFTNYSGFDPTISDGNPLAAAIDLGFYPMPTTYSIGINLKF